MPDHDVVIVGAGLAGLSCALALRTGGATPLVLEAAPVAGGRVRTDIVEGFRLDRGFQLLLSAYPEARRLLDLEALKVRAFYPGAMVRIEGKFHRVADPRARPLEAARMFVSPIATMGDKLRLAAFERRVLHEGLADLWSRHERPAIDMLREEGFSATTIDRFFRPFFGGVFCDNELGVSSRAFEFIFRMFASGPAVLPESGMGAIAAQLAARLPAGSLRLNTPVLDVQSARVVLRPGEAISSKAVVIATDADSARSLLAGGIQERRWRGCITLWFDAPRPLSTEPILFLNADGGGPVNHVASPSSVQPSYAPIGRALVGATVIDQALCAAGELHPGADAQLESDTRRQLRDWFGPVVDAWRLLRIDRVPHALPDQSPPALSPPARPVRLAAGLYVCGDYIDNASINGALESGRRAAEAVLASLKS